jgi:hypothetical protein
MTVESKMVWDDGPIPQFEVYVGGHSRGRFETMREAMLTMRVEACDQCAASEQS